MESFIYLIAQKQSFSQNISIQGSCSVARKRPSDWNALRKYCFCVMTKNVLQICFLIVHISLHCDLVICHWCNIRNEWICSTCFLHLAFIHLPKIISHLKVLYFYTKVQVSYTRIILCISTNLCNLIDSASELELAFCSAWDSSHWRPLFWPYGSESKIYVVKSHT